jgi:hypothetical protein
LSLSALAPSRVALPRFFLKGKPLSDYVEIAERSGQGLGFQLLAQHLLAAVRGKVEDGLGDETAALAFWRHSYERGPSVGLQHDIDSVAHGFVSPESAFLKYGTVSRDST